MSQNFALVHLPKISQIYCISTILVLVKVALNSVLFGVDNKFRSRKSLIPISSGTVESREGRGGGLRFSCSDVFLLQHRFRDTSKKIQSLKLNIFGVFYITKRS